MSKPPSAKPDTPPTPNVNWATLLEECAATIEYQGGLRATHRAKSLRWLASHLPGMMRAQSEIASLTSALQEAGDDTARFDWLEANAFDGPWYVLTNEVDLEVVVSGQSLREAIDRATASLDLSQEKTP